MKSHKLFSSLILAALGHYSAYPGLVVAAPPRNESSSSEMTDESDQKVEAITAQAYKTVDDARQLLEKAKEKFKRLSADPHTQKALDEVDKMFRLEYRIVELDKNTSVAQSELALQELGNARWDCSGLQDNGNKIRLLCKRHPQSYLQYLKKLW